MNRKNNSRQCGTVPGFGLLSVMLWLALSGSAPAQEANARLQLQLTEAKEIKIVENGQEVRKLVPVESTGKGDILVYTITYRNQGATPATGAAVIGAIPPGTVFLPGSESQLPGMQIQYSINKAESFLSPPVTIPVKQEDGSIVRQPAPAELFTHIRWEFKEAVPPQGTGQVLYKVKVQ